MSLHLAVLIVYSLSMVVLGLWLGRRVKGTGDFFVAGRQLGPGLIFSTLLASNIGAGSTVGATAAAYAGGLGAWWWVGSAAVGSLALALWVGPSMRRVAAAHDLKTVGDYLEFRYSSAIRGTVSVLLWIGSLFLLAGQIFGIGTILNVVLQLPLATGCVAGGVVITTYFAAGGLLASARINVLQLVVKLGGFAIAAPLAILAAGGWDEIRQVQLADAEYWSFWRGGPPGTMYLALLAPSFVVSPGLLQKVFGARDDRAVRIGVSLNALGLLLFAGVPVLLGVIARGRYPGLVPADLALPTVLVDMLPPTVGALGLAAVFSAEISAADAVLFMLATSLSQDLYKRFLRPDAGEAVVLLVARVTTIAAAGVGVVLAIALGSVVNALTIFYTLLSVGLFVPIVAGLYAPSATTTHAMASIVVGVATVLIVQFWTAGTGVAGLTPALSGLIASVLAFMATYLLASVRHASQPA